MFRSLSIGRLALAALLLGSLPLCAAEPVVPALRKERLETARQGFALALEGYKAGKEPLERLPTWSQRWLQSQLAVSETWSEEVAAREAHWQRLQEVEEMVAARLKEGRATAENLLTAKYHRLDAELELAKERTNYRAFYPPGVATPADREATIDVFVPAGATVWFDGVRTTQTGELRSFSSPPLLPGRDYSYNVRASWLVAGKEVARTEKVRVRAGQRAEVSFLPESAKPVLPPAPPPPRVVVPPPPPPPKPAVSKEPGA